MTDFQSFGLPAALNNALTRMNYTVATPIQAQAIPSALQGRDILGTAQTGTGKTAAFCIPLINHLMLNPSATALVMTPTRELATQVMTVAQQLAGREHNIRTALLIGGDSMVKQFKQLNNRPRLIIGTPGRINDHLRRNRNMLIDASFLVLDEADRMLDMGFTVQIDEVLKFLPAQRQTLMFSATMPQKIAEFSKRYMNNPVRVAVASQRASADNITHEIIRTTAEGKYGELVKEIVARDGSIIVFVKTKRSADKMARRLQADSYNAEAIHGDLKQSRRDRVIRDFRDKKHRILVATDVASRGLDVPHVEHVINYDLPQVAEDYIHRIGRTARAGAKGSALALLIPSDGGQWSVINRLLNPGAAGAEPVHQGGHRRPDRHGKKPNRNGSWKKRDRGNACPGKFAQRPDGEGRPQYKSRDGSSGQSHDSARHPNRNDRPQYKSRDRDGNSAGNNFARRPDGEDRPRRNNRDGNPGGNDFARRQDGNSQNKPFKSGGFKKDGFKGHGKQGKPFRHKRPGGGGKPRPAQAA